MRISMVVNVLVNNIVSHIAAGRAKVAPTPKVVAPISLLEFRKFYLHLARASSLSLLDKLAHWCVRGNTAKNMHVIARHHAVKYLDIHLISHLSNQITNPLLQRPPKYLVAILRDPYQVIAMIVGRVAAFTVLRHNHKTTTSHHYAKPKGSLV